MSDFEIPQVELKMPKRLTGKRLSKRVGRIDVTVPHADNVESVIETATDDELAEVDSGC